MSETTRSPVRPGSGGPVTSRGRSLAYMPPPWHMHGRTLALWFRLKDPDEARRHVPPLLEMDHDPIVRARFWDVGWDAVPGAEPGSRGTRRFLEAVVAFPVRHGDVSGDYPSYMYADDWVYIAAGRELQGWNIRGGDVEMSAEPDDGLAAGTVLKGALERDGLPVMTATLELSGASHEDGDIVPPRWLTTKIIPDATGPRAKVGQLLSTGPERMNGRRIWEARAELKFFPSPTDELDYLASREIVQAQYWSDVDLVVGWGEVLEELGDQVWDHA